MKKSNLLLLTLLAFTASAVAQTTLPKPKNPTIDEWIDSQPVIWEDTITGLPVAYRTNSQLGFTIGMDIMQRPVADDYTSWEIDEAITGELTYTLLEEENVSWSIYTDNYKLFVFTPEDYPQFEAPVTEVPFGTDEGDIEYWFVHFPGKTNNIQPLIDAGFDVERFFKYRIGIQTHYTVGDDRSSSDIVWHWIRYDVNGDNLVDVSDINILVNIIMGNDSAANYDGRAYITEGDTVVDVSDINEIISLLLGNID